MPEQDQVSATIQIIVAFDFGLRRIGVAVGQTVTGSASPLGVIANTPAGPDHGRIRTLIEEWRPDHLVVGMPLSADGAPGEMEQPIRDFIAELERYELPVATIDERHTSREAKDGLKAARRSGERGRISKQDVDAAAAVLIAERYLSNQQDQASRRM